MQLPANVHFIIKKLQQNHHDAYLVGGSVRDFYMNRPVSDFDLATSASPEQMTAIFDKTIDTGAKFGTLTVVIEKEAYEVTTFRIDGEYTDHRKPDQVQFTTDITEDLSRRDFTINAMAYTPTVGFIDPFHGQADIKHKKIKAVGIAHDRFNEDALRMLRAIRFATKLGFSIEQKTYDAICHNIALLKNISIERVREELIETFLSDFLSNAIYMNHTNVLKYIDTDFYGYLQNHLASLLPVMEKTPANLVIRWSVLLHRHPNPKKLLRFLKFSNDDIKQITQLVTHHAMDLLPDSYNLKKHVLQLGHTGFKQLLALKKAFDLDVSPITTLYDAIISKNEPIFVNQLAINGEILAAHGVKKDKSMGTMINQLHDLVLQAPHLNTTPTLINYVQETLLK